MGPNRRLWASLAGLLLIDVACGPGPASPGASPPATPAPTSTAPSIPSALPSATATPTCPAAAFGAWTRSDLPDPAQGVYGGGTPSDVIWFKGRYIAVGTIATGCCAAADPSRNVGVEWTSRDGQTWRLLDTAALFKHASLGQLVTNGDVLLAVGSYAEPTPGAIAESAAAIWVSNDGSTWRRIADPVPSMVAVRGAGFVGAAATGTFESARVRFMRSSDGLSWSYVSGVLEADVRGIAVNSDGRALAVGSTLGDPQHGVAFLTDNGLAWSGPHIALEGAFPSSVTARGTDFLVVGWWDAGPLASRPIGHSLVWRTSDVSSSWQALPLVIAEGESLDRAFVVGETIVASGDTTIDGMANAMLWVSIDRGLSWGRVADQPAFEGINNKIAAVLETDGGLLAVGRRWDSGSGHPVPELWLAAR